MPKKAEPATTPGKRQAGFLVCDECKRVFPYQGMASAIGGSDDWPRHRCGLEVRDFNRFTLTDPYRPDLPPAGES